MRHWLLGLYLLGAVKDFASAAANVYEGKWIDAFVDVGFGLYDAATDVFQAAGDATVAGAAPATALGMAEQVAQDQAQAAAKKGLRNLIPRLKKSIVDGFQSAKKTVGDFLWKTFWIWRKNRLQKVRLRNKQKNGESSSRCS